MILGVDFGLKRVGLAISEGTLATPLKVIAVSGIKDAIEKVSSFAKSEGFEKIIVGLPEGKMGENVVGFKNALEKKGLLVETSDETLSSQQAIQEMVALNIPKNKRKVSDDYSAAIILQNYLDNLTSNP